MNFKLNLNTFILFIFFSSFILLNSCQHSPYEDYIKLSSNADKVSITTSKDTSCIHLSYKALPRLSSDFLSSITAITYLDTAKSQLEKDKINTIKVSVESPTGTEIYQYPISILNKAKLGLQKSALFLEAMINGRAERVSELVDLDKISLEDLYNLNTVNEQLQTTMKVESATHDGFIAGLDSEDEIEIRAQLVSKNETIPVVFQYNTTTEKIFYFGINE
jgi:hypothetical protein